jgi:hypothetical protein
MAHARFIAMEFLRFIGRLRSPASLPPGKYETLLADLIVTKRDCWCSAATLHSKKWQIDRFLTYI